MRVEEIIELALKGQDLKNLRRTGWILAGVDEALVESVAEHTFGTALVSLLLAKKLEAEGCDVDLGRTLAMAILHDLAESQISDIVVDRDAPNRKALLKAKLEAENQAMINLMSSLGRVGDSLLEFWSDLQKQTGIEARIVLSSDILDMLIRAIALEQSGVSPKALNDFFESSGPRLEKLEVSLALDIYKSLLGLHEDNIRDND
ncbi:MAG: HD domain-containing protein [Candidatus Thorarchaeota archaeon]|jgi:putative hydrolase of HD superfamily